MRFKKQSRRAVGGSLLTAVVVVGFVGAVAAALVWSYITPASSHGTQLSFQEFALFGGSASAHSFTATCEGGAQLELSAQNPTPYPVTIQNITIYGSGLSNATIYIELSNGCLTIAESPQTVPAGGDYQLEGYVDAPIAFGTTYRCIVGFSNGQNLNETLIAQS
ncbi:MAG: hypothetical protein ACREBS_07935 [Nitrososphaerales archaeon]